MRTLARRSPIFVLALLVLSLGAEGSGAQCISLTTIGGPSGQNFDTLAQTGTNIAWSDSSTLPGWYATRTTYNAGTGASNAGAMYSFGVAGTNPVTDRALGGVGSGGTGTFYWATCFTNNTGSSMTSLDVAYNGEQWRDGFPSPPAVQSLAFQYQVAPPGVITDADTPATGWSSLASLNFLGPVAGTAAAALDGNAAGNRTAKSASIPFATAVPVGSEIWLRWQDLNDTSNDHGLAVDDLVVTPQSAAGLPNLTVNDVSLSEGNAGTTSFIYTVSLSAPAGPGGVTFDIATADGTAQDDTPATEDNDYVANSLTGQTIPAGSSTYSFTVLVNGDTTTETNETFFVNATNVTGATATDGQGQGTIVNDDITLIRIHDVQGNGAATPIPGATVSVEGVVVGDYQGTSALSGFFLEEEDADYDADPATSEGIFVFCSSCPTAVAEGQRVRVTGTVSEFNNMTEITASTAGSVVIADAGNNLAQVTPAAIDLPIAGVVNDFYEAREGMKVTFVDTLTVSEYFELARFGQIVLYEGGRPRQFTEFNTPSVAGYAAHLDGLSRREVLLDDDNNAQEWYLTTSTPPGPADGLQYAYFPRANGGFSVGTQGVDFFRGGDLVNGLTGVLHWSFPGFGADTWRLRPTAANPTSFTVANPRPATPPAVGGAIRLVGMNLLNYFTTIDTTASNSTGPCGPAGTLDCRGADSLAELNRQRERASVVICALNADVYGFAELENTTPSASITDLLGAVNTRCGGSHPYAFANTGGTLGTDAIRVQQIYRTGIVSPVGAPISDLDPIHSRPPTAQTFDVVDATNPAFGQRFTVIVNHLKSKGSSAGLPGDADIGDGAGFSNATRTAQAARLLAWIASTVLPAAGDPDVVLLGDFNSYAEEDPIQTLIAGGYDDLETTFHGAAAYSYLFDGQLGHLDYAFASASMLPQVTGADAWHINADEVDLFDYNDEVRDSPGESTFEEKPDGSALVPPRVVFQPASPYRASDHDPVVVGLFPIADLSVTKVDTPDPVVAGTNLSYAITVTQSGPDAASSVTVSDTLPAGTTFVSLTSAPGWSCTTPAIGAGGTVSCSIATLPVGSAGFSLLVNVDAAVASGTVLSNTATVAASTADSNPGNNSATATSTVSASADLSVTKVDTPDPVTAGGSLVYTLTVANAGPSNAASVALSDPVPAGTTFAALTAPGNWSCATPAVGAGGTVSCLATTFAPGNAVFTLTVNVGAGVAGGTALFNTAIVGAATGDPNGANNSATATTTVAASADLQVTKVDTPDPVTAGNDLVYTITVTQAGPSAAAAATLSDTLPVGTTFVSLTSPAGWSCSTPAVGAGGTVSCSAATLAVGSGAFTLTVHIDSSVASATVLSNTATVGATTTDPSSGNNSATATTTVAVAADLALTKLDTPDPVNAASSLTYTLTLTNAGPSAAASVTVGDPLPAGTTFGSLAAPGGWSCTTPAVGAGGTVSCSNASVAPGSAVFTLVVQVGPTVAGGTILSNTATVSTATPDPAPGNESATATSTVLSASGLSATKTVATTGNPGAAVTYTIVITNAGPGAQGDNPGDEFTDTLPAGLELVGAAATSGALSVDTLNGIVSWNGAIAALDSVTIVIDATLAPNAPVGSTIVNQGTLFFDADGNGTNETTAPTDDPAGAGGADPTGFDVVQGVSIVEIPALDGWGLALFALALAGLAVAQLFRRRRTAPR